MKGSAAAVHAAQIAGPQHHRGMLDTNPGDPGSPECSSDLEENVGCPSREHRHQSALGTRF
eukprot:217629-Pyramimonas_sp.AAC.1